MPIQKRNIGVSILLSVITCGIYGLYWFVVLTDETKIVSNDNEGASGGVAVLLTIVTCGIYGFYWAYKMGERVDNAKAMRGIPGGGSSNILYLVLGIFGLQVVNYILIQDSLNKISDFDQMNGPFNGGYNNMNNGFNGQPNNGYMNNMNYNYNNNMNNGFNGQPNNGYMNNDQMNNGYMNNDQMNNGYMNNDQMNNGFNNQQNNDPNNFNNQ